jgi:hypothetical protein
MLGTDVLTERKTTLISNNSRLTRPSRSVATLYIVAAQLTEQVDAREERGKFGDTGDRLGDAAFNVREDIGDKLLLRRSSTLGDLAIKAGLLLKRNIGEGFLDSDVEQLCKDIQQFCRRRQAAERRRRTSMR